MTNEKALERVKQNALKKAKKKAANAANADQFGPTTKSGGFDAGKHSFKGAGGNHKGSFGVVKRGSARSG